jgi:ABC transport system ATP-binding/permease protein
MALIRIRDMSLGYGGQLLFDRVSLTIEPNERVCLVGRNGEGKTTLLHIIEGRVAPDQGEIFRVPSIRIAALPQEIPARLSGTIYDIAVSGLENGAMPASGKAHETGDEDVWQRLAHVDKILTQLQLDPAAAFETLSAGMKRRALLARSLAGAPDVLLLDEPTNHMDIPSIDLMESLLAKFAGTLVFVTHDRAFLESLATRIIEIDTARVTTWDCGYATYLERKADMVNVEAEHHRQFDKKLAIEETWIRQGIKARRTRNEGRVRALMQLRRERQNRRVRTGSAKMELQEAERTGRLVIEATSVSFSWDENPVVKDFNVTVMRGDRVGIIGLNGSGKTTLLNLMLKELAPDAGTVRHGANLQIAYFDQTREQLDEEKTVQDNIANGNEFLEINGRHRHVIGYLKDFLFTPDRARSPLKTLSGGERNRLLLARLFTKPSNLLVMDEPTNDLDIHTLELLEELLLEYNGTLLLVSHDRAFLNNVVTSTLVFEGDGRIGEYIGGYDDWLCQRKPAGIPKKQPEKPKAKPKPAPPSADGPKLGYMEKRELDALPKTIEAMEQELAGLFQQMSSPDFYKNDAGALSRMTVRQKELETGLDAAYARWEELEARNI